MDGALDLMLQRVMAYPGSQRVQVPQGLVEVEVGVVLRLKSGCVEVEELRSIVRFLKSSPLFHWLPIVLLLMYFSSI
jgi:hypothetical protein